MKIVRCHMTTLRDRSTQRFFADAFFFFGEPGAPTFERRSDSSARISAMIDIMSWSAAGELASEGVLVHRASSPIRSRSAASALLDCDLTVPTEIPSTSAVSASLSCS